MTDTPLLEIDNAPPVQKPRAPHLNSTPEPEFEVEEDTSGSVSAGIVMPDRNVARKRENNEKAHQELPPAFRIQFELEDILKYFRTKTPEGSPPPEEEKVKFFLNAIGSENRNALLSKEFYHGDKSRLFSILHSTYQAFEPEKTSDCVTLKNASGQIVSTPKSVNFKMDNPKRDITEAEADSIVLMAFANPALSGKGKKPVITGTSQQKMMIHDAILRMNKDLASDHKLHVKNARAIQYSYRGNAQKVWSQAKQGWNAIKKPWDKTSPNTGEKEPLQQTKTNSPVKSNLNSQLEFITDYLSKVLQGRRLDEVSDARIITKSGEPKLNLYKERLRHTISGGKDVVTDVYFTKKNQNVVIVAAKRHGDTVYYNERIRTNFKLFRSISETERIEEALYQAHSKKELSLEKATTLVKDGTEVYKKKIERSDFSDDVKGNAEVFFFDEGGKFKIIGMNTDARISRDPRYLMKDDPYKGKSVIVDANIILIKKAIKQIELYQSYIEGKNFKSSPYGKLKKSGQEVLMSAIPIRVTDPVRTKGDPNTDENSGQKNERDRIYFLQNGRNKTVIGFNTAAGEFIAPKYAIDLEPIKSDITTDHDAKKDFETASAGTVDETLPAKTPTSIVGNMLGNIPKAANPDSPSPAVQ